PDLVREFKQTPKKKIKGRRVLLNPPSSSWPTHSPSNTPSSATLLPLTSSTLPSCPEDPARTPQSSLSSLTPLHSPSPSESSDWSDFETSVSPATHEWTKTKTCSPTTSNGPPPPTPHHYLPPPTPHPYLLDPPSPPWQQPPTSTQQYVPWLPASSLPSNNEK